MESSDLPSDYERLSIEQKRLLSEWIEKNIQPTKKYGGTSYSIKHYFESSSDGFYLTNGQFKGAMQIAAYKSTDESELNWPYNVKVKIVNGKTK